MSQSETARPEKLKFPDDLPSGAWNWAGIIASVSGTLLTILSACMAYLAAETRDARLALTYDFIIILILLGCLSFLFYRLYRQERINIKLKEYLVEGEGENAELREDKTSLLKHVASLSSACEILGNRSSDLLTRVLTLSATSEIDGRKLRSAFKEDDLDNFIDDVNKYVAEVFSSGKKSIECNSNIKIIERLSGTHHWSYLTLFRTGSPGRRAFNMQNDYRSSTENGAIRSIVDNGRPYFLHNDLIRLDSEGYFPNSRPNWQQFYKKCLLVPICVSNEISSKFHDRPIHEGKPILGILSVDSLEAEFNPGHDVKLLNQFAYYLSPMLTLHYFLYRPPIVEPSSE